MSQVMANGPVDEQMSKGGGRAMPTVFTVHTQTYRDLAAMRNVAYDYGRSSEPSHICATSGCCAVSTPESYADTASYEVSLAKKKEVAAVKRQQAMLNSLQEVRRVTCIEDSPFFGKEKRTNGIPWKITLGFWIPVGALIAGILVLRS